MSSCEFIKDWAGKCGNDVPEGNRFCEEHQGLECRGCGDQAVETCAETMGLVCGAPLCEDCEHIFSDSGHHIDHGPNGGEADTG